MSNVDIFWSRNAGIQRGDTRPVVAPENETRDGAVSPFTPTVGLNRKNEICST